MVQGSPIIKWIFIAFLFAQFSARAQGSNEAAQITNEIRNTRAQLSARQPSLAPAELDRLADVIGRSNYLARAIGDAFARDDETNAARLLGQFTGNVDDLSFAGQPLLLFAAYQNRPALVGLLLDRKANPGVTAPGRDTPLLAALQVRSCEIALRLIAAGASLNPVNARSPLGSLVESWQNGGRDYDEQMKLLQEMLNRGADPFAPANHDTNRAIIEIALANMDTALGDLLLTNRPDASRRTPGGDTALHLAALQGLTNDIDWLLTARFLPNLGDSAAVTFHQPLKFTINVTNGNGLTPLQSIAGLSPVQARVSGVYLGPRFSRFRPVFSTAAPTMTTNLSTADFLLSRGATLDAWSAAGLGRTNELSSMLEGNPALANAHDGLGRTPLHYAALASQFNAARLLIRAGADPSAATTRPFLGQPFSPPLPAGTTPLHLACQRGNPALVWMLLRARAAVNQPDEAGDMPLHLAARQFQTNCAAALIQHHAFLDITNRAGQTPLCAAVESGVAGNVELLLNAGARPEAGLGSNSLLHLAAARGATEVMKVLLRHGLALDAPDGDGDTPFQRAVASRQWTAITFLLAKGANVNAANAHGDTALHLLAAEQQDTVWHMVDLTWLGKWEQNWMYRPGFRSSVVSNLARWKLITPPPAGGTNTSLTQLLLEHHANPNLTNHLGQTPLHLLCQNQWLRFNMNQYTQRVSLLLKAGARADARDLEGLTPLHVAASNAPPALLSLLLASHVEKAGALRDANGRTPLHFAVLSQNFAATNATLLLEHGVDANSRDHQGRTPLHLAVTNRSHERLPIVNLLLGHHADPNARDAQGCTPLHLLAQAVRNGDFFNQASETLEALLKAGADASLLDDQGQTIIHNWCDQGRSHSGNIDSMLRELLVHHPNLVNLTNAAGETPLHTALRSEDGMAVQWLMQHGADPAGRNAQGETAILMAQKDQRGYMANMVHPPGVMLNFYWAIVTRNKQHFDLWLKAEPALAKITFNNGETPLMVATRHGTPNEFVSRLIELGAAPDPVSALRLGHMDDAHRLLRDATNLPPAFLFEAIRLNRFEEIEDLAASLGDLRAVDGEGHSLLYRAISGDQTNVADWLRQRGVKQTFVDDVALGDTNQLVSFLATNQASNGLPRTKIQDALMLAARHDQPGSIRSLLAHGAEVNARGDEGMAALHIAAEWGASGAAEALLLAGADPNARQTRSFAPLHIAAMDGYAEVVRLLLDHGADINLRLTNQIDQFINMPPGSTPLHWAAHYGRLGALQLLLQRGADVNATNAADETPLDLVQLGNKAPRYHVFLHNGGPGYSPPRPGDKKWTKIETALLQAGGIRHHAATNP